jgi:multiple sugar transport system ATP-binding protein
VKLGIRPEHIEWGTVADAPYLADVLFVEHMGNETYHYLDSGKLGEPWVVRNSRRSDIAADETVGYSLPPEHCHLFDETGKAFARRATGNGAGRAPGVDTPPHAAPARTGTRLRRDPVLPATTRARVRLVDGQVTRATHRPCDARPHSGAIPLEA